VHPLPSRVPNPTRNPAAAMATTFVMRHALGIAA
jgi:hypothetical protein